MYTLHTYNAQTKQWDTCIFNDEGIAVTMFNAARRRIQQARSGGVLLSDSEGRDMHWFKLRLKSDFPMTRIAN